MTTRNGADALVSASYEAGVEVCFANPGTTEMAMVDALTRQKTMRSVLALFEGVASGAADGYARIAGKPASVILHLGPGLGNATANLHNARRGQSPVVTWVGDHTTWLLPHDPPLASDIASIARGTAKWVRTSGSLEAVAYDAVAAVEAAISPVQGVATLILPADHQEAPLPASYVAPPAAKAVPTVRPLSKEAVESAARLLREAKNPLLFIGGPVTDRRGLVDATRLAEKVNGKVLFEQFPRCTRREPGLPSPEKLGYLPFQARAQLEAHDVVVVLGAGVPVPFFGYPGESPRLVSAEARVIEPAEGGRDVHLTLAALCDAVGAAKEHRGTTGRIEQGEPEGPLQPQTICQAIAKHLPENAIVVDEGITSSLALYPALTGALPHEYIACKGGSIGYGTPVATGAAVAAKGRRVVCYVGDGSSLYTLQSLWTQAREGLDVTTIILANDKYAVLQMELMRAGGQIEGPGAELTELGRPSLDFESLAKGFGVPGVTVKDVAALSAALKKSFATPGPMLISCVF
ncbi:MAG TPA: acetolactate synthase large subunit [Polyangiaceae bacterium]|nr:acetolactate synthase large subunit [Polyangiaceae bacterium]